MWARPPRDPEGGFCEVGLQVEGVPAAVWAVGSERTYQEAWSGAHLSPPHSFWA